MALPDFTLWLDRNHAAYWTMAAGATVVFFGWVLLGVRAAREEDPPARESGWRNAGVIALLLAVWRWPFWFYPGSLNPDEGQLVAGAQALAYDPVFWRAVDGGTAGPLNFYVLLGAKLVGAPVDFLTARLTGLALVCLALFFCHRLLRVFLPAGPARLALLPAALFFAIVTQDDFVHYSTEHLSLALSIAGTFLLVRRQHTGEGGRVAWWLGGFTLGLLPWAKLQSIPFGAAVVAWLLFALWRDPRVDAADKRRRIVSLLLAGLTPSLLALALIGLAGVGTQFWQNYVRQNVTYVAGGLTLRTIWDMTVATLNATRHFQACMAFPFVLAIGGSVVGARMHGFRRNPLWWLGLGLTVAAAAAIVTPRRPFAHYLLFAVLPLTLWAGAVLGAWWERWNRRGPRLALAGLALLAGGVAPLALRFSQSPPAPLDRLAEIRAHPLTAAGRVLLAYTQPGDHLGMWGWMADFYVETGLRQATRYSNSYLCIEWTPLRDQHRQEYVADLQRNRPAVFLDAVGPGADFFQNRSYLGHEGLPELAAFVRENYTELVDVEYARVYVRKDRLAATSLDPARLRELASGGRRVRGQPAPEPVSIVRDHLPQHGIAGRFVRMLHPPAEISWTLRGTERAFHFECGYDPRAYLEGNSNGTLFTFSLTVPGGATFPLSSRLLDPGHRAEDRGFVADRLLLPPVPAGSVLTLRTTPGPLQNAEWDWAFIASAAFDHSPLYWQEQFPGFNRLPDALTAGVAYLDDENNQPRLAVHAPAELAFDLKGGERTVRFDFGLRAGAYQDGGNTDGAGYRVIVRRPGQPEEIVFQRVLHPVAQPADRGDQQAVVALPADLPAGTKLLLTIDAGPYGSVAWDWTWVANLRLE